MTPSSSFRPLRLLVVCTGNICRSPMVMALLREQIRAAGLTDQIEVESAGTAGLEGAAASRYAVEVVAERGLDLSTHVAQGLTSQAIRQADLILVMEEAHRQRIFHRAPDHLYKVVLFHELVGEHTDLADPYGGERADYTTALARIEHVLTAGWPRLLAQLRRG